MLKTVKVLFKIALLGGVALLLVYTFKIGWSVNGSVYHKRKMLHRNQRINNSKRPVERFNCSVLEDVKAVNVSCEHLSSSALEDVKAVKASSINDDFYQLMQSRVKHLRNNCEKESHHGQSLTSKASLNVSLADNSRAHVRMYLLKKEKVAFSSEKNVSETLKKCI